METRREQLLSLLTERPHTVQELATLFGVTEKTIEKDLFHLQQSLRRNRRLALYVLPARCTRCEFEFRATSLKTPSRCPKCKNERIQPAKVKID